MTSTLTATATTSEMISAARAALIEAGLTGRMSADDKRRAHELLYTTLAPAIPAGVWRWMTRPERGETGTAYALRAAQYAAMRASSLRMVDGSADGARAIASVDAVVRR